MKIFTCIIPFRRRTIKAQLSFYDCKYKRIIKPFRFNTFALSCSDSLGRFSLVQKMNRVSRNLFIKRNFLVNVRWLWAPSQLGARPLNYTFFLQHYMNICKTLSLNIPFPFSCKKLKSFTIDSFCAWVSVLFYSLTWLDLKIVSLRILAPCLAMNIKFK